MTTADCPVCYMPIERRPSPGRPPRYHAECRTAARTAAKAQQRARRREQAKADAEARRAAERRVIAAERASGSDYRGGEPMTERRFAAAERRGVGFTPRGWLAQDDAEGFADAVGLAPDESAAVVDPRGLLTWQTERETDLDKIATLLLSGEITSQEAAERLARISATDAVQS